MLSAVGSVGTKSRHPNFLSHQTPLGCDKIPQCLISMEWGSSLSPTRRQRLGTLRVGLLDMWYRLRIESPRGSVALMGKAERDAAIEAMAEKDPGILLRALFGRGVTGSRWRFWLRE